MNLNKNFITSEKNRKKLKKVKKNWIVVSTSLLSVVSSGLIYINNVDKVNADVTATSSQTTSSASSSNDSKADSSSSQTESSASSSNDSKADSSSSQAESSASSSSNNSKADSSSSQTESSVSSSNDSKADSSSSQSASSASSSSNNSSASAIDDSSKIHNEMINSNPALVNPLNKQNFHYSNPQGHSNDVAGIIPHYNQDGKLDYWEGYYLWEPTDEQFGNEWYHFKTTDFSTFQPYDESDALSLKNVAIPDPNITYNGEKNVEVDKSVNKNDLPWDFIFSGSTFANNSKADGQSWYSEDQWGNKIDPDARIAFFPSAGATGYLAYSNNGQQFHPMQDHAVVDATVVGQPAGSDFRDQYVVPINGGKQLAAYFASGYHQKVYVLTSNDGINWSDSGSTIDISKIPQFADDTVESPHITTMNGTPIMFFGAQQTSDIAHSYVAYVTGEFNSNGIFQTNANSQGGIVDTGVDNYGGNFTKLDDNHQISLAWLGNWKTFGQPHMGGFTLARVLSYSNNEMNSVPIEPGSITNETFSKLGSNNSLSIDSSNKVSVNFNQPASQFSLNLKRNDNAQFTVSFDNGNLKIYRKNTINNNTDQVVNSVLTNKKLSNVQFFVDNVSVEIYIPDEQKMYTFLSLNDTSNVPYQLTSNADAEVQNYQFDQTKSPSLLNIDDIKNNYQVTKNSFTDLLSKLSQSSDNKERVQKINLSINNVFSSIDSGFTDAESNIKLVNQYADDARSHAYIALANNDLNLINSKLYQLNQQISNLNNPKFDGWFENSDGSWSYYDPDTGYKLTGNQNINGQNLYFNASGIQVKGSFVSNFDDTWSYYDANSGDRLTGLHNINGQELYFNSDGIQVKGQIATINGKQMYFDINSGVLLVNGSVTVDGINYHADSDGVLSVQNNSSSASSASSTSASSSAASSSTSSSSVSTNTNTVTATTTGTTTSSTTSSSSSSVASSSAASSASSSVASSASSASSSSSTKNSSNSVIVDNRHSAPTSSKSNETVNKKKEVKAAKAAMNKAQKAVEIAEKHKNQSHSKIHVKNYNKAMNTYYKAEKKYLKIAKLYNSHYYYDFDKVNKHSKYVKLSKKAFVYDSKQFTKDNRVNKLKKGTKVKVKKIVRHGKATRFNIGHNKFITGLKSFIHKLSK